MLRNIKVGRRNSWSGGGQASAGDEIFGSYHNGRHSWGLRACNSNTNKREHVLRSPLYHIPVSARFNAIFLRLFCRSAIHLAAGLSVGLACVAAGYTIGVVGESGVRSFGQQPSFFVYMVLILIFAEVLGLYGLICGILLISKTSS